MTARCWCMHGANFYPRPPRGGRRLTTPENRCRKSNFYPRPPRGGRPFRRFWGVEKWLISIHALREEGDAVPAVYGPDAGQISIHALREEGDCVVYAPPDSADISIHALREEGDSPRAASYGPAPTFLSTPSARRATSCEGSRRVLHPISIHALREEGDGPAP